MADANSSNRRDSRGQEVRGQEVRAGDVVPLTLVKHRHVCSETIQALEELLAEARRGRIIGLAFVAMYKKREYIADAAGEAYRNPTFTRGMVAALDDHLRQLVHEQS